MGAWVPTGQLPPPPPPPVGPPPVPPPAPPSRSRVPLVLALAVAAAGALLAVVSILVTAEGDPDYTTMRRSSASMEPTYPENGLVTIRQVDGSQVRRGDVVVFSPHEWDNGSGLFMMRAVAVGGDHMVIPMGGPAVLNGHRLDEPYLYQGVVNLSTPIDVTVPPGRLFLLGDHRSDALDSRFHLSENNGTIARSAVFGIAVDPHDVPSPDRRPAWAGAGVTAAGLLAALVLATTSRRRARPRP